MEICSKKSVNFGRKSVKSLYLVTGTTYFNYNFLRRERINTSNEFIYMSFIISVSNPKYASYNLMRYLSIYIPWPFPPVWGVADNTKEQQKQWGPHSVPLAMTRDPAEFGWHCWSNTAHPPPSSTTYVASQMPSPLLPLPQGCPYKATPWQRQMPIRAASQSFATHSYS